MNDNIQKIRDFVRKNNNADSQEFISFFWYLLLNDKIGKIRVFLEDFVRKNTKNDSRELISFFSFLLFGDGKSDTPNEDEYIKNLKSKAEDGGFETQYCLGFCYENGIGVSKDTEEAAKWYRKAVEQRFSNAPERHVREDGTIVYSACSTAAISFPQDWKEFAKWFRKAEPETGTDGHSQAHCVGHSEVYPF